MWPATSTRSQPWVNQIALLQVQCADIRLSDQAETVSRRVEKFAELMQSVWLSKNDYERRVRAVRPLILRSLSLPSFTTLHYSFCPQCLRSKRSGPQSSSQGHTQTRKSTSPTSRSTNKPRSGSGSPRSRTSRHSLVTCRRSFAHMACENTLHLPGCR